MKAVLPRFGAIFLALVVFAGAQESPYVLSRSRIVDIDAEIAWKNCIEVVRAAPVIVNTLDSSSHLVTFTMALGVADAKDLVLDSKDLEKQPLTLHVTIWISTVGQRTRLYVRAAPNGGGFFAHSSGQIELHILDAIQQGGKWMQVAGESSPQTTPDGSPQQVEAAAPALVSASSQLKLNAHSSDPAVLTLSLMIPSASLNRYVVQPTKQEYPGAAHVTFWFEPSGSQTVVRKRSLLLESGNLSPVPLASNGQLESAVLDAVRKKLKDTADATIAIGSNYRGKPEFWNVLFDLDAPGKNAGSRPPVTKDLPVPIEKAWFAALEVVTQTNIIVFADHSTSTIAFVAAHTSEVGTKYSVHRMTISFSSTDFGTRMLISIPRAQETAEESENDMKLYTERIGTELFVKDRLS